MKSNKNVNQTQRTTDSVTIQLPRDLIIEAEFLPLIYS